MAGFRATAVGFLLHVFLAAAVPSNNTLSIYESSDLVNTTASTSCLEVLSSNVTCYRGLPAAISEKSSWSSDALSMICADSCTTALNSWISSVNTACGSTTQYNISGTLQTASARAEQLLWKQSATCLEDSSGEYCNLVLQQAVSDADSSVLCSDCALRYLTTVVNSEWGQQILDPDVVESQIESCSSTASYSVTYTATTTSTFATATATASSNARCNTTDPNTVTYSVVGNETCLDISAAKNVSTPLLASLNGLDVGCSYLTANRTLCLPQVCEIYLVQTNDTCDSITVNLIRSVSVSTFRSWNPSINSQCSNLDSLVGEHICISPLGTTSIPDSFPLLPATTAVAVPDNAVTTSNTDCGYWYTIQDGDDCKSVAETFGISLEDFYFLNPQLGSNCSSLWENNSYCVQAVGSIQTYSGYNTTTLYTTLASTIDLNATRTANRSTTHFFYSFPPQVTTTSSYNSTAWNLTQTYTICNQAMAYYNITGDTEWTDEMYSNSAWYSEYERVCLVDPANLPTSAFNTSIVLSTEDSSNTASSTPASTGASPTLPSSAVATATPTGGISPNGLCGASNSGYICTGSTFGDCCSTYGYCGSTSEYCGDTCDPDYGDCTESSSSSSSTTSTTTSATPTATSNTSPNGLCGAANSGYTCLGSSFGDCCSQYGYCGSTTDYCSSAICDADYGSCS